jgi:hypothetical protein
MRQFLSFVSAVSASIPGPETALNARLYWLVSAVSAVSAEYGQLRREFMSEQVNNPTLTKAQVEARRMLALLSEQRPDADEIKDAWYALGLAVRAAIAELRQAETNSVEVS